MTQKIFILFLGILLFLPSHAKAVLVIRDAEIENTIRDITDPLFSANGLEPDNVKVFLVNDNDINAFVAGGMNIFVNTGLVMLSDKPDMLRAVLAHETGHIAGGHLIRKSQEYEKAMFGTVFSYALGIATAIASGSPGAGQAIVAGGSQLSQRNVMKYSRTQEDAADHVAMKTLNKLGYSASGLVDVFTELGKQEAIVYDRSIMSPYVLSHPLTKERIEVVKVHLAEEKIQPRADKLDEEFKRSTAKMRAFLQTPENTLRQYPVSDQSFPAKYARVIAYYKIPDLKKSIEEIDKLIKLYPKDGYLRELKGQILYENGKVAESMPEYEAANKIIPSSALIKLELASSQIAIGDNALITKAIKNLKDASMLEKGNAIIWRQLATAYGKLDNIGMSHYALAEEAAIIGKKDDVVRFAKMAKNELKGQPQILLRTNDLLKEYGDKKDLLKD